MSRQIALVVALVTTFATEPAASGWRPGTGPLAAQTAPAAASLQELEREIHARINAYRRSQNLPPLVLSPAMDTVARQHSQAIAAGQVGFSHAGFEGRARQLRATFNYRRVAENLASNRGFGSPAAKAVEGWLGSSGHQRNIVGSFNRTGIGVARASDGTYYFTQLFLQEN